MRAIFIDATARTVSEIDHTGKLKAMYQTLGCGLVDCISVGPTQDVWIDDEGEINGTEKGFLLAGRRFFGNALLLDSNTRGDCAASTVELATVKRLVDFFELAPARTN